MGIVGAMIVAVAACGGGSQGIASSLPDGVYADAILAPVCSNGEPAPSPCPDYSGPSYAIDLTGTGTNTFKGDVYAIAQDGSNAILFTYTATAQSGTASLTVTGLGSADSNGVSISAGSISTGQVLTATYQGSAISLAADGLTGGSMMSHWPSGLDGSHVLTLERCDAYLPLARSGPECDFARRS
jgi:hypothetical protein